MSATASKNVVSQVFDALLEWGRCACAPGPSFARQLNGAPTTDDRLRAAVSLSLTTILIAMAIPSLAMHNVGIHPWDWTYWLPHLTSFACMFLLLSCALHNALLICNVASSYPDTLLAQSICTSALTPLLIIAGLPASVSFYQGMRAAKVHGASFSDTIHAIIPQVQKHLDATSAVSSILVFCLMPYLFGLLVMILTGHYHATKRQVVRALALGIAFMLPAGFVMNRLVLFLTFSVLPER